MSKIKTVRKKAVADKSGMNEEAELILTGEMNEEAELILNEKMNEDAELIITEEMNGGAELIINEEMNISTDKINIDEEDLSPEEDAYRLLIPAGQAEKISPKATGNITWQLAISEVDNQLYLRLVANGSGRLFSKDWVSLARIATVLEAQPEAGFTSGVFKPLFKGASANNAGFLAAVLRSPDICLLEAHPDKMFTHVLYPDWRERLNKLSLITVTEEATRD